MIAVMNRRSDRNRCATGPTGASVTALASPSYSSTPPSRLIAPASSIAVVLVAVVAVAARARDRVIADPRRAHHQLAAIGVDRRQPMFLDRGAHFLGIAFSRDRQARNDQHHILAAADLDQNRLLALDEIGRAHV